jgi:hypothetical protein
MYERELRVQDVMREDYLIWCKNAQDEEKIQAREEK